MIKSILYDYFIDNKDNIVKSLIDNKCILYLQTRGKNGNRDLSIFYKWLDNIIKEDGTLTDIANKYDLSRERIRQIVFKKIRQINYYYSWKNPEQQKISILKGR